MTDTPTTPTATATDLARETLRDALRCVYTANFDATDTDEILDFLAAKGLTIAGPGMVVGLTRAQIPALSEALCRGIEHIEDEMAEMPGEGIADELEDDREGMIQLRDDLQRQLNAALSAIRARQEAGRV